MSAARPPWLERMMPATCGWREARCASSCVWTPLRTRGREVCEESQGSVVVQVSFGDVPAKRLFPMPPPSPATLGLGLGCLLEDCTVALLTGRVAPMLLVRSSSVRGRSQKGFKKSGNGLRRLDRGAGTSGHCLELGETLTQG